ncbi:MAG: tRNA (adenosine(37)-N6)-threonylcarbamoyltransferase complex ATPase subunit type 1 TsaE [Nocardioidaceae bacterium]
MNGYVEVVSRSADETRTVGQRLASLLHAGDVVVLSGDLGAGKTTLTQGIAAGLGVSGAVTSPTFVISRVHRPTGGGPGLVHVDAYRLSGAGELDDLDLDETLADAVTVVEWGDGLADGLSGERLRIELMRHAGAEQADVRTIGVEGIGGRWARAQLERVLGPDLG